MTRIKANASMDQNRSYRGVTTEILREAEETDRREDKLYGESRGDELPEQLRTAEGRRQALAQAKRRIEERKGLPSSDQQDGGPVEVDVQRSFTRQGGRRDWLRLARLAVEQKREKRDTLGRVLRSESKPYAPTELPDGTINLSDPDSRVMRTQGMPP